MDSLEAEYWQTDQFSVSGNVMANIMGSFKQRGKRAPDVYAIQMGDMTNTGGLHIYPLTEKQCRVAVRKIHRGEKLEVPSI